MRTVPILVLLLASSGIPAQAGQTHGSATHDPPASPTRPDLSEAYRRAGRVPALTSLLVARGDDLLGERYFHGGGRGRVINARSVSKSVLSALVGIVSLKLVVYFLYRAQLKIFSFYVWLLAAAVLFGWIDLPT